MIARLGGVEAEARSLCDAGLWHDSEAGYVFHDWDLHNGDAAGVKRTTEDEKREKSRARSQKYRDGKRDAGRDASHADSVTQRDDNHAPRHVTVTPIPSHPIPSQKESESERVIDPRLSSSVGRLATAWEPCGQVSPKDWQRLADVEPKLLRLAGERGADPVQLFAAAIKRLRSDAPTKAKRMANLAVLCSQLEQWVDDAPTAKRAEPVPACRRPL
jgi:hypothetical protein